jgi:hypothetical protein
MCVEAMARRSFYAGDEFSIFRGLHLRLAASGATLRLASKLSQTGMVDRFDSKSRQLVDRVDADD